MKKQKNAMLVQAVMVVFMATVLLWPGMLGAGELEPPGSPASTMKTLDQVEPRIPISSLPLTISAPGSYYLTGNLSSSGTGITVSADDVTIDLMGYTISGGGTGYGIYMSSRSNVEIRNGTVQGFHTGIYESSIDGEGHRVINIRAILNRFGIYLRSSGNLVKDCTANGNVYHGIYVDEGSTVTNNTSNKNGNCGIRAERSTVKDNTTYYNQAYGLYLRYCLVDGNTAMDNNRSGSYANVYINLCTLGTNHGQ